MARFAELFSIPSGAHLHCSTGAVTRKAEQVQQNAVFPVLAVIAELDVAEIQIGALLPGKRKPELGTAIGAAAIGVPCLRTDFPDSGPGFLRSSVSEIHELPPSRHASEEIAHA
jgi:hypothetical protein